LLQAYPFHGAQLAPVERVAQVSQEQADRVGGQGDRLPAFQPDGLRFIWRLLALLTLAATAFATERRDTCEDETTRAGVADRKI